VAFLFGSFVISVLSLYLYSGIFNLKTFWLALGIGVITTLTEMLCRKGWDNLFIPLTAQMMLVFFL
jgi:phytol kinase